MGRWKLIRGPPALTGIAALGGKLLGYLINDVKTHNYTLTESQNVMLEDNYVDHAIAESQNSFPWSWHRKPTERLFDVSTDIGEHHDVAWRHPDVVKKLRARLDTYHAQVPPAGTDPALSPQCKAQKPPKGSLNHGGPGGEPVVAPYCDLHKKGEILI